MFGIEYWTFDIRKMLAPRNWRKSCLQINICQDKFIQRRNSLAFDLLVQIRGKVSQMHQNASICFKNYMLLLNIIGSHE